MIILDTNVISELLRPIPDKMVLRWAYSADSSTLFTTAVSEAELLAGAAIIPEDKRRANLQRAINAILARSFDGRILPFDSNAAPHYAIVVAKRKIAGKPIKQADAQIAAICLSHTATIVTRDGGGFEHLGLEVFNPWTD